MRRIDNISRCVFAVALATTPLACNREVAVKPPPLVDVVISKPITNETISDWDTYTGTVEAKESVNITARVRGEIKQVLFTEGDEIKEKTLLFMIDDDPFQADLKQAKGQLATWNAKLKAAEEKIAIYKPLADKGTIAKEELIQAFAAKGEAIGGKETSQGKIMEAENNIKYCKIQAPITGKVGQALLTKGNIVNATAQENLLTTIVSVDPLYVYFYVNERALLNYQAYMHRRFEKDKKENKAQIPVEMALTVDNGFPHKGVVDFVDNKVDKNTGTYKVRARFDNPKGADGQRTLTAGLFARVRVAVGDPYTPILIADRAILTDQSLKYVLVLNKEKNNLVERMDIEASERLLSSGLRAVESGLKGDEWIIVEGVNRARPGATVVPKDTIPMPRRAGAKK
jgi:multidrug efflux system membrane fusion protein